ncbi:MAG TPA: hypothetical protein VM076_05880 [Gemmatimonadaceae bacterium]|nr:hypothetical protein [Gemmatimonadaceae bacterium]
MTSIVAISITVGCSASQRAVPVAAPTDSGTYVLEQLTEQRWLNGSQRPEFTPYQRGSWAPAIELGGAHPQTGERTIRVTGPRGRAGDSATVVIRPGGRVVRQDAWLSALPSAMLMRQEDSVTFARMQLHPERHLTLPVVRLWDMVPAVHPGRFAAGERWTDTIALAAEYAGVRQALSGTRTSMLIRDTVVGGRPLWIVRDSAHVRYAEHDIEHERTLDTLVAIDRTVAGTIVGRYVYDPALAFAAERADTTSMSGEAVLRYPDGRSFRTPTRYDRRRRWTLYTTQAFAAHQSAQRAEANRTYGGPVMSPSNATEQRLATGDSAFRDSLVSAWDRERDPDRRVQMYRLLTTWGSRRSDFLAELDARRMARGDSGFLLEQLANRAYPARPSIDEATARQLIRVTNDPAIPLALGGSRDALYENLVQTFTTWPSALEPDPAARRCEPQACRILEDQWRTGQEQRLRDVGLAALATRDPAGWGDTVLARVAAGSVVLRPVAQLMAGVGATWPAAAKLSLPDPGTDWRAWKAWSTAPDPRYRARAVRVPDGVRFEESHATAIRFYEVRTGRDVVGELRRGFAGATDDSARLVFGTMLAGLGEPVDVEQVVAQFRSGSAPQIALAQQALHRLFGARPPRADSATTAAVLDRLIASTVDKRAPWPSLGDSTAPAPTPAPPTGSLLPVYVLSDSLPPALRERWRDRVRLIGSSEWNAMSPREAASLRTFSDVRRVGPILRVSEEVSGRMPRQPNETPRLYYEYRVYYLLARGDGWVIVRTDISMT